MDICTREFTLDKIHLFSSAPCEYKAVATNYHPIPLSLFLNFFLHFLSISFSKPIILKLSFPFSFSPIFYYSFAKKRNENIILLPSTVCHYCWNFLIGINLWLLRHRLRYRRAQPSCISRRLCLWYCNLGVSSRRNGWQRWPRPKHLGSFR